MKIIQNALKCPDGTFIKSLHRHDFCQHGDYYVDGGIDYIRRSTNNDILSEENDFVLTTNDNLEKIKNKLLWGTYGKDGKGPYTQKLLIDCETNHLEKILETQSNLTDLYKMIINSILEDRKNS